MAEADIKREENTLQKKPPQVPIPTYRWEEIRRSKLKGGYPWTHLYKDPFSDEPHPEHYTMEEFRRSKSSSTLTRPNTLEIQELPNGTPSEKGSADPIITEAVTPEAPPKKAFSARDSIVSVKTLESAESSDNISQYLDKDEIKDSETEEKKSETEDKTEQTKMEEDKQKELIPDQVAAGPSTNAARGERAKSEEPTRKRKLSIESSYSRISLSKLAVLKKLKDAKEKVKLPKFSFRKHKEEIAKKKSEQDKAEKEKKRKEKRKEEYERLHADKPVYIHIPLKPPPGETDEFSYLEFQGNKEILPSDQQAEVASSPDSTDMTEVQFIVLTPPSDDEVLSDHTIPETPSESEKFFDTTKIEELKTLAKNVVDQAIISSNKLETVKEENGNGKEATPPPPPSTQLPSEMKENVDGAETEMKMEVNEEIPSTSTVQKEKMVVDEPPEKMLIDEEDGLRSSETTSVPKSEDTKETQNIEQLSSQVEEKRLSFRRKFKKSDPDRIYEDVQVGGKTDDEKLKAADISQSMSVDEEKAYLEQKVMNHTSLEEDYNKWSKTNDHEYEPVCPPPDDAPIPPPSLQVIDASNPDSSNVALNPERNESSHDTQLTAQELQSQIEEQYFTQEQTESTSQVEQPTSQQQEQKGKKVESNKFQQAIKDQAGKFKTKIQGIKRPHITMPSKPTFKIEKPKINFPKIPDTTTIHLPSFNLTKKRTPKRSLRERQFSTESNAGDSKKHHLFDFSTYPRWFGRKKKDEVDTSSLKGTGEESAPPVEFATVPRSNHKKKALASKWAQRFKEKSEEKQQKKHTAEPKDRWEGKNVIRIPLHSEDSMDTEQQREESLETETISHTRFNEDIDAEEGAYHKENQEIHRASPFSNEYNSRWTHGTFHQRESPPDFDDFVHHQQVTDLDNDIQEPETPRSGSYDVDTSRDTQSSRGSLGSHRRGVVEEISADEFIIRQKGISQDDIDVRKYLTSEIREAFTSPQNVLYQLESEYDRNYDLTGSNQSLPEKKEKRTPIKKPKRKKTPHVSQEEMSLEPDYPFPEETLPPVPPARPVRKNKKEKKNKKLIPFQETIPLELEKPSRETDSILAGIHDDIRYYDERENPEAYENECMEGIEQPEIHVTDPYAHNVLRYQAYENTTEINEQTRKPEAPPRKQKSLRSLDYAEEDLTLSGEIHHVESILKRTEDQIIPVSQEPPQKPSRNRSRTRSQSLATSQPDEENVSYENQQLPCVEEPCIQDIRDPMGYAIIDKTKIREPPLPPPRTPPRRRRSLRSSSGSSEKFATVPRSDSQPIRPLRNYSTLGPSRPPRIKSSLPNLTDEEKENIDITPYIEIDEEATRRLQSGAVIQKMKDRPLPAPPRPPRKTKLPQDENAAPISLSTERLEESEVSTQTEPLPEDIEIAPEPVSEEQPVTRNIILQTPTHYTHEECITHGSLIVEPLNGAKIIPDHEFSKIETSRERIIPVTTEDEEETSEIPDEFHRLSNPPPKLAEEKLKAQRLHVDDLDVNRLTVNELLANKISVSQIDGVTIQVNEITSRDGAALKVNEIELPSHVIQQLLEKIQAAAPSSILVEPREQSSLTAEVASTEPTTDDLSTQLSSQVAATVDDEQKKTSIVQQADVTEEEEPPQRPPRQNEPVKLEDEPQPPVEEDVIPPRPPRSKTEEITDPYLSEQEQQLITALAAEDNLDVDDEPPPRPPNPASEYFPSQPPASFYALRAEEYKQEDIPLPPRRRRYHHQKVVSRSSSDEESSPAVVSRRRVRTTPEPTIPQLTCQLAKACSTAAERQMKRLISHIVTHVLNNEDGQQDLHVTIAILLVLIAGLILLGFGEGRTTVHHHHWEFFNPPKEL